MADHGCTIGRSIEKSVGFYPVEKWICLICGYLCDPERGDPKEGIPEGALFERLPNEWVCSVCGVTKDLFKKT